MADGAQDELEVYRKALVYPQQTVPEFGEVVEITPEILWSRLPLEGQLKFINVWALKDGDGWALVDTGLRSDSTTEAWRKAFQGRLKGEKITRVFVTHMHPDHSGMAGWLTRKFNCRLWMTRVEYMQCRMLMEDTGRDPPQDAVNFYKAAGWTEDDMETYKARFGGFGKRIYQLPDSYRRIQHGETIRIGDHDWQVVVGSGHSPEHACLYCPDLKVIITGDQVLPRISSNVSVFPTEPDGDPLTEWLFTLARIKEFVPNDVLVLPAHNDPFHGLYARIDHLIRGHERGLERLRRLLAQPKRVIDVFGALFARQVGREVLGLATGEALAHLNCLMVRGQAKAAPDEDGVLWYSQT